MSSASSTTSTLASSTVLSLTGRASGASSVFKITNSWALGPSFEMLNVTDPAGALLVARSIEKSFSVADTPPVSEPAELVVLEELLHATAPSSATAAVVIVSRLKNRSMDPSLSMDCVPAYEGMRSPDNLEGNGLMEPLEIDAGAELARRLFGPGLNAEGQPNGLVPVDPEHDRVRALGFEH